MIKRYFHTADAVTETPSASSIVAFREELKVVQELECKLKAGGKYQMISAQDKTKVGLYTARNNVMLLCMEHSFRLGLMESTLLGHKNSTCKRSRACT